jgi:hypothetical protein
MAYDPDDGGQLHTLGLLERLRVEARGIEGVYADLYRRVDRLLRELSNPNLHDIANMNHRVELWTADGQQLRWAVAATASVTVGHAAFEAAVRNWPHERFTLRNGILVIREHGPNEPNKSQKSQAKS